MGLEIEIKIRVEAGDLPSLRNRVTELGALQISPRTRESNFLFDFPDGRLTRQGQTLRLRVYGAKTVLTFKGALQADPLFKKREEVQTRVADEPALRRILEALDLAIAFEYSKFREIYRCRIGPEDVELSLDETDAGAFVELEGSPEAIQELAAEFGWSPNQFIKKNYVQLLSEARDGKPKGARRRQKKAP